MPKTPEPEEPECTLDNLCDDADLLTDALKTKLFDIREHAKSVQALKQIIQASEAKSKKDMATLIRSLRELRAARAVAGVQRP